MHVSQWAENEVAGRHHTPAEEIAAEVARQITEGGGIVDYVEVRSASLPLGHGRKVRQSIPFISTYTGASQGETCNVWGPARGCHLQRMYSNASVIFSEVLDLHPAVYPLSGTPFDFPTPP